MLTLRRSLVFAALAVFTILSPALARAEELVVHEWGTFTCLQDENGKGVGGINTDDEPVPDFVHNIAQGLLIPTRDGQPSRSKSIPRCHTDVTMRLETPIIYFYPEKDFHGRFGVTVQCFRGWLTQYFPDATAEASGIRGDQIGSLERGGYGRLEWKDVSLGDSNEGPATSSLVWTTPRRVEAATVEVKGEHEKFLFYRGVANLPAPLSVVRSGPELTITKTAPADAAERESDIRELWLLDVRSDGSAAFRVVRPFAQAPAFVAKTPVQFDPADYGSGATKDLKTSMHEALVRAGLFKDEADALLDTWRVSYFKSPGLRLFFLVPEKWTNATLPLRIRRWPHEPPLHPTITRVMVGRIEIVSPEQRALLAQLSDVSATAALGDAPQSLSADAEKVNVSERYQTYLRLGRFRNALVLDERKRRPGPGLDAFIKHFELEAYVPPKNGLGGR